MYKRQVYACVRVIAETVASLPLNVFEATDKGGVKALEHPLQRLLHDEPNPEMTSFIWRETMLSHLLLWGNSYCQILRTGRNGIVGLYPLLPDHMEVDRDSRDVYKRQNLDCAIWKMLSSTRWSRRSARLRMMWER